MRIMIFEWLTGGGMFLDEQSPNPTCPFQGQGSAMLEALAADFDEAGHRPVIPVDERLASSLNLPSHAETTLVGAADHLAERLRRTAATCDHLLLIAPESGDRLLSTLDWLSAYGDRLISPDRHFVALASNKSQTIDWLSARHVPTAPGTPLPANRRPLDHPFPAVTFPAVIKPNDGAGSEDIQFVATPHQIRWPVDSSDYRIETFVPGVPVSVSVIFEPTAVEPQPTLLPPTGQQFDDDPIGAYSSALYPLPDRIADRATELAQRTVAALPSTRGYFGIDLVIADAGQAHDVVIEINPRMTTSYTKLRKITSTNLAKMMLPSTTITERRRTHEPPDRLQ